MVLVLGQLADNAGDQGGQLSEGGRATHEPGHAPRGRCHGKRGTAVDSLGMASRKWQAGSTSISQCSVSGTNGHNRAHGIPEDRYARGRLNTCCPDSRACAVRRRVRQRARRSAQGGFFQAPRWSGSVGRRQDPERSWPGRREVLRCSECSQDVSLVQRPRPRDRGWRMRLVGGCDGAGTVERDRKGVGQLAWSMGSSNKSYT